MQPACVAGASEASWRGRRTERLGGAPEL